MNWFWKRETKSPDSPAADALVTYADWSRWFDRFAVGGDDDAQLALAARSTPQMTPAAACNFARRAAETLSARLNGVGTMLQNGLRNLRSENDVVLAIVNARSAFSRLRRYAELPCWPETLRKELIGLVDYHLSERQKLLLKNATEDRFGRFAVAIRNNPLDRLEAPAPAPAQGGERDTGATTARPRRPILL